MAARFTVYAGEPLASTLAGFEDNRSGRINMIADAYREFVADNTPALSASEWCAISDAGGGAVLNNSFNLRLLWAVVADRAADGLAQKWGVDIEALAGRLRSMRTSELLAVREVIQRYLSAAASGSDSTPEDLLRTCGARFA